MDHESKKAAVAEYKKRKAVPGMFAVTCSASGERWVGRALNLESIQTRLWFGLRTNGNQHPAMQAAWNAHGAESFAFEELELLDEEALDFVRDKKLKQRLDHWRAELGAAAI